MVLYVAIGLCALLAALLVYRYDLYEREPWYTLVLAALIGALGMRVAGAIELASMANVQSSPAIAALAALHEELARLIIVSGLALLLRRNFNDPMDGIVYGSIVGLGMAVEESYYVLGLLQDPPAYLLPVETVRLTGHLIMGGIVGFAIGLARTGTGAWKSKLVLCFSVSFALHFLWDVLALATDVRPDFSEAQTTAAIALILFGMLFYGSLVLEGSRLSKSMFAPTSEESLWGWPFSVWLGKRKDT